MFGGELYSDFVLLWLMAHATRFAPRDGGRPETCWLEEWTKLAEQQGTRALGELRGGVEKALQILGEGFTGHPKNAALRDALRTGRLSLSDFHGQLLRVVYRLIFLFVAEDRTIDGIPLLHPRGEEANGEWRMANGQGLPEEKNQPFTTRYSLFAKHYSTSRLRELAGKIKGSRHGDLWQQFNLIVGALSGDERFAAVRQHLALPALGSFLWSPSSTSALNAAILNSHSPFATRNSPGTEGAELTNHDFLEVFRHLAFTRQGKVLRPVDYKNLGAEELGGVYESLLALSPQISADGARFTFAEFAGSERKMSGSYYTPDSLVQCLLDSALDPVVEEAIKGKTGVEAEKSILSLKVCDPAVGSGHFLVGAAHRLARHLARVRAQAQGESEPSPLAHQQALRNVIGRCLYGVDVNPMAAELCRVSLWLEALEPGKPLSFLDHHLRVGNSLLGTTPELIAGGLPNDAFRPIEGDDKKVCSALRKRNKQEREGQMDMLHLMVAESQAEYNSIESRTSDLEKTPDDTLEEIRHKAAEFHCLVVSPQYKHAQLLADAWCAAFVWKKETNPALDAITTDTIKRLEQDPDALSEGQRKEVERLAAQYRFFHWHLAFPEVFAKGGFDCVLGNPPWERLKLAEDEWFAAVRPDIANAPNAAARAEIIDRLASEDSRLHDYYSAEKRRTEGANLYVRASGAYPLCGVGDINTYAVFAELNKRIMSRRGRIGCVLQAGIATDKTTSKFFGDIIDKKTLVSLYSFDNHDGLFPHVKRSIRFCLLTLTGSAKPFLGGIKFTFYARSLDQIYDPIRCVVLTAKDIALLNPNTNTCPVFQSAIDCGLVSAMYRRIPVVVNERKEINPWHLAIRRILDMNKQDVLRICVSSPQDHSGTHQGVFEAKLFDQLNHRASSYAGTSLRRASVSELQDPNFKPCHRYYISAHDLAERFPDFWEQNWLIVWQDVTDVNTMARTVTAAVLPLAGTDFTVRVGFPRAAPVDGAICFVSLLNTIVFDYVSRQKIGGTHLSDYIMKQLPILPPHYLSTPITWSDGKQALRDWLLDRVLELIYTAWDLEPFGKDCGWSGPPFRWDEERRFLLRCELDAAFFHLYLRAAANGEWRIANRAEGAVRDETPEELAELKRHFPTPRYAVSYIMDTFPIVKRKDEEKYDGEYRTKRVILEIYDEMAQAMRTGNPYKTRLDPPPGPPTDEHGNFLPLPEWKPGQSKPEGWPSHIHPPKGVG